MWYAKSFRWSRNLILFVQSDVEPPETQRNKHGKRVNDNQTYHHVYHRVLYPAVIENNEMGVRVSEFKFLLTETEPFPQTQDKALTTTIRPIADPHMNLDQIHAPLKRLVVCEYACICHAKTGWNYCKNHRGRPVRSISATENMHIVYVELQVGKCKSLSITLT